MTRPEELTLLPDAELVARMVGALSPAECEQVFAVICHRHQKGVLRRCGELLADNLTAAQEAAQDTFTTAYGELVAGKLREPEKLRAWLYGIARNRCRNEWRRRGRMAELPADVEDDTYDAASRRRRAEVDRIMEIVAAGFTPAQQRIYRLNTLQRLKGRALAKALNVSEAEAYDDAWENKQRLIDGFGAYVLAKDGRAHCPELAEIVERAAWNGEQFTKQFRARILRHMGTCKTCGNCGTCRTVKGRLLRPYAPVILPIVLGGVLADRVQHGLNVQPTAATSPVDGAPPGAGADPLPRNAGRSARRRLRRRIAASAAVAAVVAVTLVIVRQVPSADSTPAIGRQQAAAAAVADAMVRQKFVAFDIEARNLSDPAEFHGQGRIDMTAGPLVAAATHVLYEPGEDPWFPPDVILIGSHGYSTPDNTPRPDATYGPTTTVPDTGGSQPGTDFGNAVQTRWLASPSHIGALLRAADRFTETDSGASRTFTGQAPLSVLASDPVGGFFYQPYQKAEPGEEMSFTLVTDSTYLPASLNVTVPYRHSTFTSDPFKVVYRNWAVGSAITAPADPPTPQWGGLPSPASP